jgi:hypothetical protein
MRLILGDFANGTNEDIYYPEYDYELNRARTPEETINFLDSLDLEDLTIFTNDFTVLFYIRLLKKLGKLLDVQIEYHNNNQLVLTELDIHGKPLKEVGSLNTFFKLAAQL